MLFDPALFDPMIFDAGGPALALRISIIEGTGSHTPTVSGTGSHVKTITGTASSDSEEVADGD
jgi:hypothetical protein